MPYGVKVKVKYYDNVWNIFSISPNGLTYITNYSDYPFATNFEECKPYLFPLSSMTEEQIKNIQLYVNEFAVFTKECAEITIQNCCGDYMRTTQEDYFKLIDWLNKNHFDYRGLIDKGLAIDATGLNIY